MASSTSITIDVNKDLESFSDLKNFFSGQGTAIFDVGLEIAKYRGKPVQSAIGPSPVKITLQGDPSWKTGAGICLSLGAGASCTLGIGEKSTCFTCNKSIDSNDPTDIVAGPVSKMVYINIDLDFDIKGGVSGSGSLSGIGIAGKASGSACATLSYCHPVNADTETETAVRQAFAALVFPFDPECAVKMPAGSIGKVNFDGSLDCELDVTYGLCSYKFSAQNLGAAKDGVQVGWDKLQPPSLAIDAGAKGSFEYTHSDNFSVIVHKLDPTTADLYLVRSASNETKECVGITVGVSACAATVTVDPAKLTSAIAGVVKKPSSHLPGDIESGVSDLQSALVSKANAWLSSKKGDAGLMLSLSQQSGRTMLFSFRLDLSTAASTNLAKQSWAALMSGNLRQALRIGGFTLQPGSGIADHLKHSSTIQLHFFNFQLAKTTDFFENSITRLAPDGSIRFFYDVGQESQFCVRAASASASIHFVATATEATSGAGNYANAEVDLYIELSETDNPKEAAKIANAIGALGINTSVRAAQQEMLTFVGSHGKKTLTLISIFKPTAYQKLKCSPYTSEGKNTHPPALPQARDKENWNAFQAMAESLMPDISSVVSGLSYDTWMLWNVKANYSVDVTMVDADHVPDRKSVGEYTASSQNMFGTNWQVPNGFLLASTRFIDLCDNLHWLANAAAQVSTAAEWNNLLKTITGWVKSGVDPDWSKPALGALLYLCSLDKYQAVTDLQPAKDNSKFVCTLTLS